MAIEHSATIVDGDPAIGVLRSVLASLAEFDHAPDDAARIDRIALLEQLRGAVAAAQAREMVEFEASQVAVHTMALTGFVPVEHGVAAWTSLDRYASSRKADGDRRTRRQIMADAFIERLTGQQSAEAVPVTVSLAMSPDAFAGGDDEPAELSGYGPLPADIARGLAAGVTVAEDGAGVLVRRLFTDPVTGVATDCDSRSRRFSGAGARLLRERDQVCRTLGCGAPIRHLDHIEAYYAGGRTSITNGQGLCERCSYIKETPGWRTDVTESSTHATTITTPTGHRYTSQPPPALGAGPSRRQLHQRGSLRRLAYLQRERLIANLPSPADPDP